MTSLALHDPFFQVEDSNGLPRSGAKCYFYSAGTTNDLTVYQDGGGVTPHAQPVVADSDGIFAPIYVTGTTYKTSLKTSADIVIQTVDNIVPPISLATADQQVTGGALITTLDLGTKSSGTLTPDPGARPVQRVINGGAFTLAPGASFGNYVLDVTNNASAGAVTTSGWTKVFGAFDTTNGHKFKCFGNLSEIGSLLTIQNMF